MNSFALAISRSLQYGVSLTFNVAKLSPVRHEPDGWTEIDKIPYAKSIIDYIFGGGELGFSDTSMESLRPESRPS